ncbi:hypothetical protein BC831DRAFT_554572 [Entophlyctis helioformis]|nr:hypothetical protein BC831DRAFT_554572 [Entophlyctis helioformis]
MSSKYPVNFHLHPVANSIFISISGIVIMINIYRCATIAASMKKRFAWVKLHMAILTLSAAINLVFSVLDIFLGSLIFRYIRNWALNISFLGLSLLMVEIGFTFRSLARSSLSMDESRVVWVRGAVLVAHFVLSWAHYMEGILFVYDGKNIGSVWEIGSRAIYFVVLVAYGAGQSIWILRRVMANIVNLKAVSEMTKAKYAHLRRWLAISITMDVVASLGYLAGGMLQSSKGNLAAVSPAVEGIGSALFTLHMSSATVVFSDLCQLAMTRKSSTVSSSGSDSQSQSASGTVATANTSTKDTRLSLAKPAKSRENRPTDDL